jgi:pilus assembly protein Flp/PilA
MDGMICWDGVPLGTPCEGVADDVAPGRRELTAHCGNRYRRCNVEVPLNPVGHMRITQLARTFWSEDSGQGLVEYALIIALVAVGLIAILLVLRNSIGNVFNNAATQLNNAPSNPYP